MSFFSGRSEGCAVQNESVARGAWGEEIAVQFLRRNGWRVIDRNVRPYERDERKEIDIVAYFEEDNMIAFIEVKTHKTHNEFAPRNWGVDRAKKRNLLPAFRAWLRSHRWSGNYRFDIIEVYGDGTTSPEIDHIINVPIFPPSDRFYRY